ncbi:glutamyl-tRNA(Gln) amidotransferase subunit A [Pochonia chlamydosporia 170]|uniref:Glutamyl-tRNA(Gln) amidotransferase subunit A n=1 Tax=Pochonia chlamydosporia 170 TaxID=1380566 RepID=A0A179G323_METCM|nr:glutamyl-tRNA(Gln) amidotransferase subunit A [Pochonia chlamydosporia 170]OAQ72157.1 glutamyl-tRNA(Gln) amidotransferase subunit A [Pochonia chlamydosporia 170]
MKVSKLVKVTLGVACSLLPLGVVATPSKPNAFPSLLDATLDELRHGLDSGHFTSVDLTKAYIARIKEVSQDLRPVNEINPDALTIAAAMDAARKDKSRNLGPLHGIPVLIKDNIATLDKMNNTAGSYALLGATPKEDSTMVAKLRKAGVIILGKANLSQWANYRSYNTSNGWTSYGGQTKGAYFRDQDPSGSSSGSGVSSSIGLAWAALGTETDGSIISPSNVNNLVGIKPSVGLTSRYLVVPISEHQDTIGPMARTVKDAAYLLAAIAGADKKDNYTSAIPFNGRLPDYVGACKKDGLKGKRLGVPRNWLPPRKESSPVMKAFEATLKLLRSEGATIIDDINTPGQDMIGPSMELVLGVDMLTDVATHYFNHLKSNPHNITTLQQLQEFTQKFPKEEWPRRDTQLWQNAIDLGFDNTSPQFWGNYTEQLYYAGPLGILGALKNNSLDAIVVPSDYVSSLPAIVGSPIITVPLGKQPADTPLTRNGFGNLYATAPNLPFGLAFAGARFSEEKLIEIAYAFEQKTKVRGTVRPLVKPRTELRDVVKRTA